MKCRTASERSSINTTCTLPSLAHMGTHTVYQPPAGAAAAGTFTGGALGTTGWWNAHGQGRYPANWATLTPQLRHAWIDSMITAGGGVISQATGVPVGGRYTTHHPNTTLAQLARKSSRFRYTKRRATEKTPTLCWRPLR